jgi:hypothetical protein
MGVKISIPMRLNARGGIDTTEDGLAEEIAVALMPAIDINPYRGQAGLHRPGFEWESLSGETLAAATAFIRRTFRRFERTGRAKLLGIDTSTADSDDGRMRVEVRWSNLESPNERDKTTILPRG